MSEGTQKKKWYVYEYYRLGHFIYNYTILVFRSNLQLWNLQRNNSSKVWYFLLYSNHEKLMETINIRIDPYGLLEWP